MQHWRPLVRSKDLAPLEELLHLTKTLLEEVYSHAEAPVLSFLFQLVAVLHGYVFGEPYVAVICKLVSQP